MQHFEVPAYESFPAEAKPAYDQFVKSMGRMPNLYATIGYSAVTLNSYLAFVQAQVKGAFHGKDREAIYLIVSQINGCEYCLAAHTASAIKNGWTEDQTLLLRAGNYKEAAWEVIYGVIQSVIEHRGEAPEGLLDRFYQAGYTNKALMDLMALINIMSFTNYVYRLTKIPIDFPLAKAI
jgi:AhpD family alkylhydroperoxidase